jgi:hypothetical protein
MIPCSLPPTLTTVTLIIEIDMIKTRRHNPVFAQLGLADSFDNLYKKKTKRVKASGHELSSFISASLVPETSGHLPGSR